MADYSEVALVRSMRFLSDSQAAIAHNLANANTQGFKAQAPIAKVTSNSFRSLLAENMPTVAYREYTVWTQGAARPTGEQMHVAINGDYFFRVKGDDSQTFYTRRGELQIDDQGRLVTPSGLRYLDETGNEIVLMGEEGMPKGNLKVSPDGRITEENGDRTWGPIVVVDIPDKNALVPVGGGVYRDSANQVASLRPGSLSQGYLEQSNVETVDELMRMISVQRSFQATQKALTSVGRIKESFVSMMMR